MEKAGDGLAPPAALTIDVSATMENHMDDVQTDQALTLLSHELLLGAALALAAKAANPDNPMESLQSALAAASGQIPEGSQIFPKLSVEQNAHVRAEVVSRMQRLCGRWQA